MRVLCVNQDPGISPDRSKGAAIHLMALREAFGAEGAAVLALDEPDAGRLDVALEAALAAGPVDLVYERYALGGVTASRFARRTGVPHVLEVNAPLLEEARAHRGVEDDGTLLAAEIEAYTHADRVLAVSSEVARSVLARGVASARVVVRPNAVDAERFLPLAGTERSIPGVPDDRVVLGWHGRLRPWHGFERLAALVGRLLHEGLPVHLLAVGAGDVAASLRDRVPSTHATTLGWRPQSEVARIVARFDLMALTYPPEAPCYFSPLKLLEAMAVGAVPVVPDLGDLSSVVRHGHDGLVVTAGDDVALYDSVVRLVEDSDLRRRFGDAAIGTARRRSWRGLAAEIMGWTPGLVTP